MTYSCLPEIWRMKINRRQRFKKPNTFYFWRTHLSPKHFHVKKPIVEFIGTFWFALAFVMASNLAGLPTAIIIGAAFATTASVGGHFNPATSLALLMLGKMDRFELPAHFLFQTLAAVAGALVAAFLLRCGGAPEIAARSNEPICALVAEFFGTFAFVWVILNAWTTTTKQSMSYALFGGLAMLVAHAIFNGLSGGFFNPALAVGMAVVGAVAWGDLWIYILGELLGAAAATSIFQILNRA